jgi:hypothetical protein
MEVAFSLPERPRGRDFVKILAVPGDFAERDKASLTAVINTPFQAPFPRLFGAKGRGEARHRRGSRRDAFPPDFLLAIEELGQIDENHAEVPLPEGIRLC